MSIVQGAIEAALALPLAQKLAAVFIGLPVLAIVINVLSQLLLPKDPTLPPVVFHVIPWFGSAAAYGMDPYKFLFDCREKYGDVFTFILLGRRMTVALGPKGNNLSLGGKITHVSAEEAYTHLTTPVFGKGVVYDCPNDMLMQQKKFIKHGLTTEALSSYAELMRGETRQYFRDHVVTGKPFEVLEMMQQLIILTASRTLQGKEVRENLDIRFAKLLEDLDKGFTPVNFLFPNLPLPSYKRRDKAQKEMSDFYMSIIEKRRSGEHDHENDMIAALQGSVYKNGVPLSDRDISHIMIAILMAGSHTSSATSSWFLLHLAYDQELQQALYDEQVQLFGNADGSFREMTLEDTRELPLMTACIRETLRLHAPIHSIYRKVMLDIAVPPSLAAPSKDGTYVIPKGHFIVAAPGVSQMDPRIWKDAKTWRPRRWLEEGWVANAANEEYTSGERVDYGFGAVSKGTESPYQPFGAGRHRCVGEQFAYLQLTMLVSEIIRTFKVEPGAPQFPETNYQTMIVLPLHGMIKLEPRK
nr:lanosterol 14-alpha-demethylase [Trichosporon asahii]UYX79041.1 lanosterol 14-alpha-demethylase [Trichosporon asahii]UYX79042.1 lanosterol 14-alpha-demethylase [Trichosporon asahii]UYX79043.1 lanosterol 14-alpha-demethylase [Trichosporon asahii]UYX79044.1 lanosterol 14-alpha-demethylase [Trichosporon asahii]